MAAETVALDKPVPAFSLPSTGTGTGTWANKDAAGSKLVLYFYPRDNTPGCTQEGKDFAAAAAAFRKDFAGQPRQTRDIQKLAELCERLQEVARAMAKHWG